VRARLRRKVPHRLPPGGAVVRTNIFAVKIGELN
jgi:hypothetical protein